MDLTAASPRLGLEVLVTVVPEGGFPHLGRTSNLSPSGMLLEIEQLLDVGTPVQLKLFLPGTLRKLELSGEIVRDAGRSGEAYRYGVRFGALPADVAAEIERFLAVRLERQREGRSPV